MRTPSNVQGYIPFDRRSIRHLRQNRPNEVLSADTYQDLLIYILRRQEGVLSREDWYHACREHFGDVWSEADLRLVGNTPKWKNQAAWGIVCARKAGQVLTRGQWIVLDDARVTDTEWLDWAAMAESKPIDKRRLTRDRKLIRVQKRVRRRRR